MIMRLLCNVTDLCDLVEVEDTHMDMQNTKNMGTRLSESKSIHEQLVKMGIMMDVENRKRLSYASNEYVKNARSSTIRLRVDDKSRAIVHFKARDMQQSGVVLEYR